MSKAFSSMQISHHELAPPATRRLKTIFFLIALLATASAFAEHAKGRVVGAAGGASVVVTEDGGVWTFDDLDRLLGPRRLGVATPAIQVGYQEATGVGYALDARGNVYSWMTKCQRPREEITRCQTSAPVRLADLHDVTAMSVGEHIALFVLRSGAVLQRATSADKDALAQCGPANLTSAGRHRGVEASVWPVRIGPKVRLVSAGFAFAGAIDVDGRLWTWGSNSSQALGRATDDKYSCEPAIVVGLPKLTQLSAGSDMMYATDINGKVWGWGQYSDGKFSISKSRPTLFAQVDHPASIYGYHGALYWIDQSGIAWETGHGIFSSPEPQPVPLLSKVNTPAPVSSVSLALQRAVAIDEKGSLWGWSGETTNFPGTVMNPRHIPFITE